MNSSIFAFVELHSMRNIQFIYYLSSHLRLDVAKFYSKRRRITLACVLRPHTSYWHSPNYIIHISLSRITRQLISSEFYFKKIRSTLEKKTNWVNKLRHILEYTCNFEAGKFATRNRTRRIRKGESDSILLKNNQHDSQCIHTQTP